MGDKSGGALVRALEATWFEGRSARSMVVWVIGSEKSLSAFRVARGETGGRRFLQRGRTHVRAALKAWPAVSHPKTYAPFGPNPLFGAGQLSGAKFFRAFAK